MQEKSQDNLYYEMTELVLQMLGENASDAELERLRFLLKQYPQALDYYSEIISVYVGLSCSQGQIDYDTDRVPTAEELLRESIEFQDIPEPIVAKKQWQQPSPARKPISWSVLLRFCGGIAAMIAVAILLGSLEKYTGRHNIINNTIAVRLIDSIDARWSQQGLNQVDYPHRLNSNKLSLEQGYAVLAFDNGSELILEAPVKLEIVNNKEINLNTGRITAKVDASIAGFVVNTPGGKMVDLGTEFGVDVKADGNSELYVFDGEVSIAPLRSNSNVKAEIVTAGNARRLNPNENEITKIPFSQSRFVQKRDYHNLILANEGSSYHRWMEYNRNLRNDPDVLALYDFEKRQPWISNIATATAGQLDGLLPEDDLLRRPEWTTGRWPEKAGLKFDGQYQQYVKINWPETILVSNNITFAAWIKPDDTYRFGHIISKRNYHLPQKMDFQWAVFRGHYMQFSFKNNTKEKFFENGNLTIRPGSQWYHLAMTFNADNNQVAMYLNGQLQDYFEYPNSIANRPAVSNTMYIGTDFISSGDANAMRGTIDELIIINRTMRPDEIEKMFIAGQPD